MAISDKRLRELAVQMAAVMDAVSPPPPEREPRVAPRNGMCASTREVHISLIRGYRSLYRQYGMHLVVDQYLTEKGVLENLDDDELLTVRAAVDTARECITDGISFEERGLLRNYGEVA